jgi:hypothetical protein
MAMVRMMTFELYPLLTNIKCLKKKKKISKPKVSKYDKINSMNI